MKAMKSWNPWIPAVAAAALLLVAPATAHHPGDAPAFEFKATASDGPAYPVAGLRLQIVSSDPSHPKLAELPELQVSLGQVRDGYTATGHSRPEANLVLFVAPYSNYYASAVNSITKQIRDHLVDEGFKDVVVYALEQEIDPETGTDLRGRGQLALHLLVRAEPPKGRGIFQW